jgi:hypothetical protein
VGGVEAGEFAEGVAQARGVGGARGLPQGLGDAPLPATRRPFDCTDQAAVFGLPAGNLGVTEGNPRGTGETVMGAGRARGREGSRTAVKQVADSIGPGLEASWRIRTHAWKSRRWQDGESELSRNY